MLTNVSKKQKLITVETGKLEVFLVIIKL